jgi:hypothetical protein
MKSKEGTRLSVSWVSFFHFFHTKLGQAEFLKSKGVMHCKYFFPRLHIIQTITIYGDRTIGFLKGSTGVWDCRQVTSFLQKGGILMKYLITAVIAAISFSFLLNNVLALWFLFKYYKLQMMRELLSDKKMSENACRLMKESTNCRIRLLKADAARKGKSSRPTPAKLRQLLFSVLNTAITAVVSVFVKSLIEGLLG